METGTDVQEFSFYETPEAYHADHSAIRSSGVREFRKSRTTYYHRRVRRVVPEESTDALRFGSALDIVSTTPDESERIVVYSKETFPNATKGTSTQAFRKAEAENPGKILLTPDQFEQVHACRSAMHKCESVRGAIWGRGKSQVGIRWQDKETGLWCKALLDRVLFDEPGRVTDLKTTRFEDLDEFEKSILNYGYHQQLAWYVEAFKAVTGFEPTWKLLVTVSVSDLWPHVKEAYADVNPIDPESLEIGRLENRKALNEMAECYASGNWSNPERGTMRAIGLPEWYRKRYWKYGN